MKRLAGLTETLSALRPTLNTPAPWRSMALLVMGHLQCPLHLSLCPPTPPSQTVWPYTTARCGERAVAKRVLPTFVSAQAAAAAAEDDPDDGVVLVGQSYCARFFHLVGMPSGV